MRNVFLDHEQVLEAQLRVVSQGNGEDLEN
jgi:hypothetical protein